MEVKSTQRTSGDVLVSFFLLPGDFQVKIEQHEDGEKDQSVTGLSDGNDGVISQPMTAANRPNLFGDG